MLLNIHKYIYITIAVIFIVLVEYGLYYINDLKNQRDQWKEEANKVGIAYKISDSLWKYTAYINQQKMDSIIKSNKDITEQIKKGQEKPLIVTVTKERVYIEKVPADTTKPDPTDSTYRIATVNHKDGWYELEAKYQVVKPWNFEFSKVLVNNKRTTVVTKLPNGRIAVYTKSINPFIIDDSTETIVDPVMIQLPPKPPTWKWITSLNTNFNSNNYKMFDVWEVTTGIYAPFNLGINTGVTYLKGNTYFKFGLGYIYNF
jgi:tetrahydromethanopterin S-methyltransferase subunit B